MPAKASRREDVETVYVAAETELGEPATWHWRRECRHYPDSAAIAQVERPSWRLCVTCWRLERTEERSARPS